MCVFFTAAQTLINKRIAEIEAQLESGAPAEGMYLTYLLSSDKLTRAEVYISITELLLGGVDTVRRSKKMFPHRSSFMKICRYAAFAFFQ